MARQKCYLIESILEGLPIPEVFIQIDTDETGIEDYAVVDGQQRIRAILQFIGADDDADQADFDKFALDKLPVDSPWYGITFADLTPDQKRPFFAYQVTVRLLESATDAQVKDMFRRLNKFTAPLKPAELRNATYAGPFARLAVKLADEHGDFLTENRIVTAEAIRRMGDVEFFAELMIGAIHGPQGGSAGIIDEYYQQYEDSETEFPREKIVRKHLAQVLGYLPVVVPTLKTSRWSNKSDFYSLVTALVSFAKTGPLLEATADRVRQTLSDFGDQIDYRVDDEDYVTTDAVVTYARAVSRGANEKSRRVARHQALRQILSTSIEAQS